MPAIANAVCQAPFITNVSLEDIEAYIKVIPEDEFKDITVDEPFTVTAKYIIGEPAVLDIPFVIHTYPVDDFAFPNVEIISVNPINPNIYNGATVEQTVIATAIFRSSDPANAGFSPSAGTRVRFEFEMFQLDYDDRITARHSGPDAEVPNVTSANLGNYQYVSWDSPVNENGEEIDVDIQVNVEVMEDDGTRTRIATDSINGYEPHHFDIDYEYLNELVARNGGVMSRTQPSVIIFRIKPDKSGTVFNQDDIVINVLYPFIHRATNINDALQVNPRIKYRLSGGVTVPYLALDLYTVARRQEDINYFQYRIRQWGFHDFTDWADVSISSRSRFLDLNGNPTRNDVETDESNQYLGPWGIHAEITPTGIQYFTNYVVEARTVKIVDGVHQTGEVRTFNVRTPQEE